MRLMWNQLKENERPLRRAAFDGSSCAAVADSFVCQKANLRDIDVHVRSEYTRASIHTRIQMEHDSGIEQCTGGISADYCTDRRLALLFADSARPSFGRAIAGTCPPAASTRSAANS